MARERACTRGHGASLGSFSVYTQGLIGRSVSIFSHQNNIALSTTTLLNV